MLIKLLPIETLRNLTPGEIDAFAKEAVKAEKDAKTATSETAANRPALGKILCVLEERLNKAKETNCIAKQTTLRTIVGQIELDELLSARESVNKRLADILDHQSHPWGIKVTNVEVKQIDLPVEMQRAMAKQAEAERERRAKIIAADAELQASVKLSEAAKIMEINPMTMQLRYLQTIQSMAGDKNTTTIVPLPIELLRAFSKPN